MDTLVARKKKKKKTDSGVQPMVRSQNKRQFTLSQISGIPGSLGVTVHLEKEVSDMEILREDPKTFLAKIVKSA